MKINLGPNTDALAISRRLGNTQKTLSDINERLTTGLRILKSSDDAAGAAVADSLKSSGSIYSKASSNISNGVSLFSIAGNGLSQLSDILSRIKALALEGSSESVSYEKRQALDDEAQALATEYTRIIASTEFNDIKLINSPTQSVNIQTGVNIQSIIQQDTADVEEIPNSTEEQITYEPNGSFDPVTKTTLTGLSADSVQLYDLDADGDLDSIIGDYENVTIALNDGNGNFTVENSYATGFVSFSLNLGDFNNDGIIDILSTGGDGSNGFGVVLTGLGNGTFQDPSVVTSYFNTEESSSFGSTVGYINNDQYLDIVTSGREDTGTARGTISVFFGNGTGSFSSHTTYTMHTSSSREVKLGDVNGDTHLDIVSVGYNSTDGAVSIRLGDGTGNFGAAGAFTSYYSDTRQSYGLQLQDLNNDEALDIITSGQSDSFVSSSSVLMGNGDGTFQNATNYVQTGTYSASLILADFDSDNNLDLVTTRAGGGGGYSIRFGDSTGAFGARTDNTFGSQTNAITYGDVNSDGAIDFLTTGFENDPGQIAKLAVHISQTTEIISQISNFSLLTAESSAATYESVSSLVDSIDQQIGKVDGFISRLKSAYQDLETKAVNFNYAESRIRDYALANKTSKIAKLQIVSDSGTAMFAQANQDPARVLALIEASTNFEVKKQK